MCQAYYHILRSIKTRFTWGRLFYTQGPFFCALGPVSCALVREEAIFAVFKRCANEGFACMCKEDEFFVLIINRLAYVRFLHLSFADLGFVSNRGSPEVDVSSWIDECVCERLFNRRRAKPHPPLKILLSLAEIAQLSLHITRSILQVKIFYICHSPCFETIY